MGDVVMVEIPVSPRTAERLRDEAERARAGQLLDRELGVLGTDDDPLFKLIREIKADARAAGITDEEIDAELAAYNAERRDRC